MGTQYRDKKQQIFLIHIPEGQEREWGRQDPWRAKGQAVFQDGEKCESSDSGRTNPKQDKWKATYTSRDIRRHPECHKPKIRSHCSERRRLLRWPRHLRGTQKCWHLHTSASPSWLFQSLHLNKLGPLVFKSMQISFATCILKYVFALSYDIKYIIKLLKQTMAKTSPLQQSQVTQSGNSLWENVTLEIQEGSSIGNGENHHWLCKQLTA